MKAVLGQVVFSDDPSSNPADAHRFFCKICVEKNENNQKGAGVGPLKNNN